MREIKGLPRKLAPKGRRVATEKSKSRHRKGVQKISNESEKSLNKKKRKGGLTF